ncbi:MAG TPA: class I SAM-dependent methyltransferase [Draconibacterium sp.]|nr:class I SAM-dependent methyltransferase [Tenuifilaceae bacterium]HRX11060.1 class I SAM-dependent methyltransferase [Draconibacterium sp.]
MEKVITGNVFDKYNTKNPVYRYLMKRFFEALLKPLEETKGNFSVLEIGCGEGLLAREIGERFQNVKYTGFDIEEEIVAQAKSNFPAGNFFVGNVFQVDEFIENEFDYVIVSEVLEHIDKPSVALEKISGIKAKQFILSVPHEPWWRLLNMLRLHYLTDFGNTPGHLQHWSHRSFGKLVRKHFANVKSFKVFPWNVAYCKR